MVTTRAFLPSHNPDAAIVGINADIINHPASHPIAAGTSAYASSKFAQLKFLEYVAAEHPDLFIVSVHPGCVDTDMLRSMGASEGAAEQGFMDDVSLPANFTLWVVSPEARFLRGKFVCANWDVEELKAKAKEVGKTRLLEGTVNGWPYGEGVDDMLARA